MTSKVLARIAGWSSILSVLVFIVAFVLVAASSGTDTPLTIALFLISSVFIAPVFYALYVFHRSQAQAITLTALIVGIIAVGLSVIAPTPTSNALLFNTSSVLFGIAILIFGYLGLQNAEMPRPLAIIAILTGIMALVATALTLGALAIADLLSLAFIVLFLVWASWLGWLLLKGKLLQPQ